MSRVKGGQNAPLCSSASLFSCPKYLFTFLSSFREREKAMLRTQYREFVKIETGAQDMNFWAFSKFLYGITPPPPTYFTEEKSYQITKEEEAGVINPENCSWQFFRSNYKSILCRKSFFQFHGVWKSQKSLIQHCERSELRLHFEWTKVN